MGSPPQHDERATSSDGIAFTVAGLERLDPLADSLALVAYEGPPSSWPRSSTSS